MKNRVVWVVLVILSAKSFVVSQKTATSTARSVVSTSSPVPRLIRFSGIAKDEYGKPLTAMIGITFLLYQDQQGSAPLWMETQNVQPDANGSYSVQLGATNPDGLPTDVFTSGEAHWLGVQVLGQPEPPRVLLLSVPYALKAGDAETLGGKPVSDFVLVTPTVTSQVTPQSNSPASKSMSVSSAAAAPATITGGGTTNFIPIWTNSTNLGNSILYQIGSKVGIGTTTPSSKLQVISSTTGAASVGYNNALSGVTFGVAGQADSSTGIGVAGRATAASGVGVRGLVDGGTGVGVYGLATAASGATTGVLGRVSSASGIAGVLNNTAGGKILSGRANGVEKFGVDGAGNVTAAASTFTANNGTQVVNVTQNGSGLAINASNKNGASGSPAIQGVTAFGVGVAGLAADITDGVGVIGAIPASSLTSFPSGVGVYGVGGNSHTVGVVAQAQAMSALIATNGDSSGGGSNPTISAASRVDPTLFGPTAVILASGPKGGSCTMDSTGSLSCTGTKSAVVPLANGGKVALYAMESPENWFEDFGSGKLSSGATIVTLDASFAQTVNTETGFHVFLTPNGDCKGLYVVRKTPTSFEVHELGKGRSDVSFDYRIIAHRKGYETLRLKAVSTRSMETSWKPKYTKVHADTAHR